MVKKQQPGKKEFAGPVAGVPSSKQAEQALRESEEKYRSLVETAGAGIATIDIQGIISFTNDKLCQLTGYSREDIIGKPFADFLHKDDLPRLTEAFLKAIDGIKISEMLEFRLIRKDGKCIWVHSNPEPVVINGQTSGFSAIIYDISDRKRAEEALRESEAHYRALVEGIPGIVYSFSRKRGGVYYSSNVTNLLGYSPEQLYAEPLLWQNSIHADDIPRVEQVIRETATGAPFRVEYRIRDAHGNWHWFDDRSFGYQADGTDVIIEGLALDITDRKLAEETIKSSLSLLSASLESTADGILIVDKNGKIARWNQKFADMWKIPEEVLSSRDDEKTINYILNQLADPEQFVSKVRQLYDHPEESSFDQVVFSDGRVFERYSQPQRTEDSIVGRVWSFRDITRREQAMEAILRSKLLLQSVIDSTPDWMYVKDPEHKFLLVNKSFANAQNIAPQDMIGRADTNFFPEELCLGNPDKGMVGFHTEDLQALQGHVVHNPRNLASWADGSLHIYDTYKIPLTDQSGKIYSVLVYSRDITQQAKAEDERETAIRSLQKTLDSMISTMSRIVEMRDPYTAGHQKRVAELAGAIATEMKLNDSQIDHLLMAARIHDIGKMYVPSDILNKPGKLADIEWNMIKTHAQGSYDILQDIEFSQPVALMVLQHHERLDGSGYPNGLKGQAILLEARILAVADVIEAMASHRPYRPTVGIEKALEEISQNRGRLYDPDVVDTCLELFKSGRFEFKLV